MSWHFEFEQSIYISFVHVLMLIILGNFDNFAFWPIARVSIVPSLCGHFQTGYASGLPVSTQRHRVVRGLKLSRHVLQ